MEEFQDATENQSSAALPKEPQKSVSVPVYDKKKQIKQEDIDLKDKGNYNDPVLQAIQIERTRALRERQKITGQMLGLPSEGIMWALKNINPEVGQKFDAHGFSDKVDPVKELENLMIKGIDPNRLLYTTEFRINEEAGSAMGADYPKAEGGIVLLGQHGQLIKDGGIKYVVVGEEFVNTIGLLRQRYQQVEIIPWHDAPKRLTAIHNDRTGENISAIELNAQNHPRYVDTRIDLRAFQNAQSLGDIVEIPPANETPANIEPW